jgi:hypothetical protein
MKKIKLLTICLCVLVFLLVTIQAVSSLGDVDWFRISDSDASQSRPGLANNPAADQFLVVWEDYRGSNSLGCEVYGQLVNRDGSMSGANIPISIVNGWQRFPKAAYNTTTDQYLVIWEDQSAEGNDIDGQLVNANGSLHRSELTISAAKNNQNSPEITYNPAENEYLVVFSDDRLVEYDQDIYGVLVNADGTIKGEDFLIDNHIDNQSLPVVAYNSQENQYLVVWQDSRNPASSPDIYARVVNPDGSLNGSDFPITMSSEHQAAPDVVYDADKNRYLVVWEQGYYVYGRLLKADKTFAGQEFKIGSVYFAGQYRVPSDPAVGYDGSSKQFLAAWSVDIAGDDIYASLVSADGSLVTEAFRVASGEGDSWYPDMAYDDSENQFLIVWRHETCTSTTDCEDSNIDIYGIFYGAAPHLGLYLPLVIENYHPSPANTQTPTRTATSKANATATPTPTSTRTPTSTATPTRTATPTATSTPKTWTTILSEDFEASFPGSWNVLDNQTGYGEYYWGKRICSTFNGSYSGWAVGAGIDGQNLPCGANYPNYADSWMIYGPFSLTDATEAEMRFKAWVNTQSLSEMNDYLCWMASLDGAIFHGDCTWGNSSGWFEQVLDFGNVSDYGDMTGQPQVWAGFYFHSDAADVSAEGAYVDDILIRKCMGGGCAADATGLSVQEASQWYPFPTQKLLDHP